jgi:hypothetical protein
METALNPDVLLERQTRLLQVVSYIYAFVVKMFSDPQRRGPWSKQVKLIGSTCQFDSQNRNNDIFNVRISSVSILSFVGIRTRLLRDCMAHWHMVPLSVARSCRNLNLVSHSYSQKHNIEVCPTTIQSKSRSGDEKVRILARHVLHPLNLGSYL